MLLAAAPAPQAFHRHLLFEPNRGQAPAEVKWLARGPGYQLFFTSDGVTMAFPEGAGHAPNASRSGAIRMKLRGARPWDQLSGFEPTGGISNYIRGTRGGNSLTNIPHYARFRAANVYKGIDIVFYSREGQLEYDFVAAPGADPKQIQLAFDGADRIHLDAPSGDLLMTTRGGSVVRQARPKVYQQEGEKRIELRGGYKLLPDGEAAFTLSDYDPHRPLVIDPAVGFSKTLGGSDPDQATAVAADKNGNVYVTGWTLSANFPTARALQPSFHECQHSFFNICATGADAFVTKLSPNGDILFSTFLGGSGYDDGRGIAVDSTGIYIAGTTDSSDFPNKIPNSIEDTRYGHSDGFVTKLSPDGSELIYSRIVSRPDFENTNAVAVDSQHAVWITGATTSRTFLVGEPFNYYYANVLGPSDVYYEKFGPSGEWQFSGILGGSGDDSGTGIAIDPDDNPWLTGQTCSTDFPATPGYNYLKGRCGVFVARIANQTQTGALASAMVFGGSEVGDSGSAIAVDASRQAYITGFTRSSQFPVTAAAYRTSPASGGVQAFVMKVDGLHWSYSTLLGGDGDTFGNAIAINAEGEVSVGGQTTSTIFPGTATFTPNPTSGFITKFPPDLSSVFYAQQAGASVQGIAVLEGLPGFPLSICTAGSDTGGNEDALVMRLNDTIPTTVTLTSPANPSSDNKLLFTAVVDSRAGWPEAGNVTFLVDGVPFGPYNIVLSVYFSATLSVGSHTIQAKFNGVGNYEPSISAPLIQVIKHPTRLTLTPSVNPSSANQPVTFTAKLSTDSGNATGNVWLFRKNGPLSGPSLIGIGALSGNVATITVSSLFAGDNIITAAYDGSTDYMPAQSFSITQTVKPAATSTKISSSANPSKKGQKVKFTVKVSPAFGGTLTGTVTFKDGANTLKTASLSGGKATFSTSRLGAGRHSISASYGGDASNAPSSKAMTQQIQ